MLTPLNANKEIAKLGQLIDAAERIVVVTHMSPDGDAIGSSTAFRGVLETLGKEARIVIPDMMLESLLTVPGAKEVIDAKRYPDFAKKLIKEANLIICLDFNMPERIAQLSKLVLESPAPKVLIDHHLHPGDFAEVTISRPEMSSTCFLLFKVLCAMELFPKLDRNTATDILTGMMTDTGNFSYNASDPELYIVVSELLKLGADKESIYRHQFNTDSLDAIRLNSFALLDRMEVWPEYGASLITLTRDELNSFHYTKGDTEGLVNRPLAIPGIVYSMFMREEEDYVKVSMRSIGSVPVNEMCRDYFGGGGHRNAAGGEFHGKLESAIDVFKSILKPNLKKYSEEILHAQKL